MRDKDGKFGTPFAQVAEASGIELLRTPDRAPRANATCARCRGSVRRECLDHLLVLGERHLHRVLREYGVYLTRARPHQGLGQGRPAPPSDVDRGGAGPVRAILVLGGLHHAYQRAA